MECIEIYKMRLSTILPHINGFYNVLSDNRARLEPWFWWASPKITPNKFKFASFILLYLLDTKRKEIMHKFSKKNLYDEQFMIYYNGEFYGMMGLDKIDDIKQNAELWGFMSGADKTPMVVDESTKIIEDYCIKDKNLKSLYAKTQLSNRPVAIAAVRNGYKKIKTEYGVRISERNEGISELITWEKQLVK
ncbi:MAG: hypothetical protein IKZ49_04415 [Alphaproteobacteria bacterium]|nr:hypothetical protein [Alphaproteobacteria bacterium]